MRLSRALSDRRPLGTAVALLAMLSASTASAIPPMHYSARLVDTSGTPLRGDFSVQLQLFSAPADSAAAWTQTYQVSLDDGQLELDLLGLDPSLVQQDSELGLSIDTVGLDRRSPLLSVARAERSARVQRVQPGDVALACTTELEGTLRRTDGELQGCTATGWRTLSR